MLTRRARAALALSMLLSGCAGDLGREAGVLAGDAGALPSGGDSGADAASANRTRLALHPLDQSPEVRTVGMDSVRLAQALERAATLPRLHNMIVVRHGQVVAERHFRGPALDRAANVKSASKSVISALIGIAIADGLLAGVDQSAAPFFERYLASDTVTGRSAITIGHLLTMRSGLETTSNRNYGRWVTSSNWVRHAITRPIVAPPGEQMIYSTGNTHLLSAILTQVSGKSTHAFAQERLASPLGIRLPPWPRDPQGIYFGGNDMLMTPRDLLRFGELYRNRGSVDGKQILPESWVRASWEVTSRTSAGGGNRFRNRDSYGLGWWGRDSNGYGVRFAWGYGGQFLFVVPALELTVVFTSDPVSPREGPHNQELHRMMDELLVPAAIAGATNQGG